MTTEELWTKVFERVEQFRGFTYDWDGLGAYPPQKEHIDDIQQLLLVYQAKGVRPPNFLSLNDRGEIYLEWRDDKMCFELEYINSGKIEKWVYNLDGRKYADPEYTTLEELLNEVEEPPVIKFPVTGKAKVKFVKRESND